MPTRTRPAPPKRAHIDPFQASEIRRLVAEFGSPLLIVDCQRVREQYRKLHKALPGVDLHYALKPLPHPAVVETIVEAGGWLDLATTGETQLVTQLGIDPARCIHTHPIKRDIDIRNALHLGVRIFVADNPDEVRKFEPYRDQAELLLRVSFRSPGAVVRPVAKIRLRSRGSDRARAPGAQAGHPAARPVVPRGLAGHGSRQARRSHRSLRETHGAGAPRKTRRVRHARHRRRLSHRIRAEGRRHRSLLRAHPRRAGQTTGARAGHRRARALHLRPGGHRRCLGHGTRAARRPLVVLPRRRSVRLVQRPALRPRQISRGVA